MIRVRFHLGLGLRIKASMGDVLTVNRIECGEVDDGCGT